MRIKAYLHGAKEGMRDLGERSGLTGEALANFGYALYEVGFDLDVDESTGDATIAAVDGNQIDGDKDTRIAELTQQCDVLANAIVESAKHLSIVDGAQPLTGPQVILLVEEMAKAAERGMALRKSIEAIITAKPPPHRVGSMERHLANALETSASGRSYSPRDDENWRRPDSTFPPGPTERDPETRMATAPQAGDGAEGQ